VKWCPVTLRHHCSSGALAALPLQVKNYFNNQGYERWRKIYGQTDDVNKVQLDIRNGHAQTVEKVLKWVDEEGGLEGVTVCDAGCGTGTCVGRAGGYRTEAHALVSLHV